MSRGAVLGWCCLVAACSGPATPDHISTEAPEAATAHHAVAVEPQRGGPGREWLEVLGAGVTLADREPNLLHGDFDGDGIPDLLAVVVVSAQRLNAGVRVVSPWPPYDDVEADHDLSQGAEVSLAIIHGTPHGGPGGVYLLHDPAPISILDTQAARSLEVVPHATAAALWEPELVSRARGDLIVVPTEAGIDTYVHWDGATYRALQPQEEP